MCGRYEIDSEPDEIAKRYKLSSVDVDYKKGDKYPSNEAPVILNNDSKILQMCKWGFYTNDKKLIINARGETLNAKPMFNDAFAYRRCLIPANHFYEWKEENGRRKKYKIGISDSKIFSLAAIYNIYLDRDNRTFVGFTVITTESNEEMSEIHERMPLILEQSDEEIWLDKNENLNKINNLIKPFKNGKLTIESDEIMENYSFFDML